MKTRKMSLSNIKDVLSREELKMIMAGSGGSGSGCGQCSYNGKTANCEKGPVTGGCICGLKDTATCS